MTSLKAPEEEQVSPETVATVGEREVGQLVVLRRSVGSCLIKLCGGVQEQLTACHRPDQRPNTSSELRLSLFMRN